MKANEQPPPGSARMWMEVALFLGLIVVGAAFLRTLEKYVPDGAAKLILLAAAFTGTMLFRFIRRLVASEPAEDAVAPHRPSDEAAPKPTASGFIDLTQIPKIEPAPGCRIRTPYGRNLMLSYLEMDAGAEVPLHSHPHEQGGVLLSGTVELTIGDETRRVTTGSLFLIPPNIPHRAVAVGGPAVVLDVFSPIREDYAELANRYIPPVGG